MAERKSSRLLTLGRENQCNYRCDTLLNLFLLTLPTQEAATQNERNEAAEAQLAARCFLYDIIEGTGAEKSFMQRLKANLKPFLEKLSGSARRSEIVGACAAWIGNRSLGVPQGHADV